MLTYDRNIRALAVCLAALAGFCDAIGFLSLGGFFVSFMSGNSTRMSVGLAEGSGEARVAAGLIAAFVLGVVLGSLTGRAFERRRPVAVLALVTLLLGAAAALGTSRMPPAAIFVMALAMGAANAVFERDGEVRIGVTYMTGTLVKLGQRIAAAVHGGARFAWLPYLLLWMGLAAGAVAGAAVYPPLGLAALWPAAAVAGMLTVAFARLERQVPPGRVELDRPLAIGQAEADVRGAEQNDDAMGR